MANSWVKGPDPDRIDKYGDHPDQLIEFYGSTGPQVAVIHGGYWRPIHNREHMRAYSARIAANGYQVANIEYRRDPQKPELTFNDVKEALGYLKSLTAIVGFSVGGQLALLNSESAHKLILLAPVTDLQRTKNEELGDGAVKEFFGEIKLEPFDPMYRDYSSHIYIIHGDADDRVPISHSRDFVRIKGGALTEIPGADHFGVIDPTGLAIELSLKALA